MLLEPYQELMINIGDPNISDCITIISNIINHFLQFLNFLYKTNQNFELIKLNSLFFGHYSVNLTLFDLYFVLKSTFDNKFKAKATKQNT